jgi:hypothetical protein
MLGIKLSSRYLDLEAQEKIPTNLVIRPRHPFAIPALSNFFCYLGALFDDLHAPDPLVWRRVRSLSLQITVLRDPWFVQELNGRSRT